MSEKTWLLLVVCLISFSRSTAQLDSLKNELSIATNKESKLTILNDIINNSTNYPDSVLKYANQLLLISEDKDVYHKYLGNMHIGQVHYSRGNYPLCLQYLLKSLKYSEELKLTLRGQIKALLGGVYGKINDIERRNSYYFSSIEDFKNSGTRNDSFNIAVTYNNLGERYLDQGQPDSAKKYYSKALFYVQLLKTEWLIELYRGNIGIANARLGFFDSAEVQLIRAVDYSKKVYGPSVQSIFIYNLADVYFKKGDYTTAEKLYFEGLSLSKSDKLNEQQRDIYKRLANFYEKMGDYKSSLLYYKNYLSMKDSVENIENVRKISDLRANFEISQKQAEVDLLAAQKRNRELVLIGTGVILLLLVIGSVFIYRNYQAKNRLAQELASQKQELENLNQTKDKLFSIVSHDLRGPVSAFMGISNMINYFVKTKNTDELVSLSEEIDKSVKRLSALLDNLLSWAMQQQGSFTYNPEKIDVKNSFSQLFENVSTMASSKHIDLSLEIPDDLLIYADRNTSQTIFRNLVTNAMKFTPENGKVKASAHSEQEFVKIIIEDTGVGIPKDKMETLFKLQDKKSTYGTKGEKGLGLGLQLVQEFIDFNNASIEVDSEMNKGTRFTLTFPKG